MTASVLKQDPNTQKIKDKHVKKTENLLLVFCTNKQRSFEPLVCLDLATSFIFSSTSQASALSICYRQAQDHAHDLICHACMS